MHLVRTHALATFDETIDIVIQLNVDPKHGDQIVKGTSVLPNSLGNFNKHQIYLQIFNFKNIIKFIYNPIKDNHVFYILLNDMLDFNFRMN